MVPNPNQSPSTRPLTYVIIPLLALFILCSAGLFFYIRRRTARAAAATDSSPWAQGRWVTRDGTLIFIPRHYRRNPWGGLDSREGLNELGEAPPPYLVKKLAGQGDDAAAGGSTELRDMEEGRRPPEYINGPPGYIAEPPPAITTDSRRTGA
ncbi:hypothetical protein ACHAQJ_000644 [Trichoderma viride]